MAVLTILPFPSSLFSQADTFSVLPTVTITDIPSVRKTYSSWQADSLPATSVLDLSDRLLWEMPIGIRANAPGTLATVSARGAGPSRTAVVWQGLNLQSPMNGVVDVALIPLWPGDQVEIQRGGLSALESTGAMGGVVRIHATMPYDSAGWKASAGMGAGSFGRLDGQGSMGYSTPRINTILRASWRRAKNDFPFQNTAIIGTPTVRQTNNFGEKLDVQQYTQFNIDSKNTLESAVWRQQAFREIPPAMTEGLVSSWQKDRSSRAVVTWTNHGGNKVQWQTRAAWLDEFIAFKFSGGTDTSRSRTARLSSEFVYMPLPHIVVRTNVTSWYQQARADGYSDSTVWFSQWRLAGSVAAEYRRKTIHLHTHLRQEWAEGQGAPFTWVLGSRWTPRANLTVRAHISRNFNLPTFNDRFWRALGNPNLRPESGYSTDVGVIWKRSVFQLEAAVFQMLLDDWILWQPGLDGQFRPDNLRQVRSRGAEISGKTSFLFRRNRVQVKGQYQFVRVTNVKVFDGNSAVLHKQLPYTPEHVASASMIWTRGNWSAAYLHQWTGQRFTTTDNSRSLTGFQTGNLFLQYKAGWGRRRVGLSARIENCWNSPYQVIEFRPMPGRAWLVGVILE